MTAFDVVVAGGGVNGLACAATLAREGLSVCVVERNPWVGGGAVTREVTLPGFKHDMFGSSHVWIQCNADFKAIQPELERFGLEVPRPPGSHHRSPRQIGRPWNHRLPFHRQDLRQHRALFGGGCRSLSKGARRLRAGEGWLSQSFFLTPFATVNHGACARDEPRGFAAPAGILAVRAGVGGACISRTISSRL